MPKQRAKRGGGLSELAKRLTVALRKIKARDGLSERQLALKTNLSYAFFRDLMSLTGNPSLGVLDQIAEGLKIDVDSLLIKLTEDEARALDDEYAARQRAEKALNHLKAVRAKGEEAFKPQEEQ